MASASSNLSEPLQHDTDVDYWSDARTPLSSLLFLLPWIAAYEAGILLIAGDQSDSLRNGADFWMRSWLSLAGIGQLLLPVLVICSLLIWHIAQKYPWRFRLDTLAGMFAESLLLAVGLVAVGQLHDFIFRQLNGGTPDNVLMVNAISGEWTRAISFIGAGVYEEVMFRLLLVPLALGVFRMFEFPPRGAALMAAISSSFIFALAHHIGPSADAFNLFTFSFRAAAGMFFAAIFLMRGIGITVGCHAAYDLLVGVLLTL